MSENKIYDDAISRMNSKMSTASIKKSDLIYEQESLAVRLALLREERHIPQNKVSNFTQSAVSKLEHRKDIKISTLIDYLDSLGMGLEIITYPKEAVSVGQEKVLLKI